MPDNPNLPFVQLPGHDSPHFEISETNYSTMPDLAAIEPHRHDYQTIIWTQSGTGQHLIDGYVIQLIPNSFCLIARGQVHRFIDVDAHFALTSIRFNDAFLPETIFGQKWSYRAALFNNLTPLQRVFCAETHEVNEIESLLELMKAEYGRTFAFRKNDGLRYLLQFLLLRIARLQQRSAHELSTGNVADHGLFRFFVTSLEEQFTEQHSVQYYADAVNSSADKLSELTKQVLGKSAKEVILDRISLEAKRLLQFSDLSVKEIAFALGFDNPHHFSRAFKNRIEISPSDYRKQNKKMV